MLEADIPPAQMLPHEDGERIAYYIDGEGDMEVLWCGGFSSEMTGEKASTIASWGIERGHRIVRFDYFGHGQSSGKFAEGTIGRWKEDAALVQEKLVRGRHIVVGSSMGGWISMMLALQHPERVAGLLLLAPAPNFTERLLWNGFSEEAKRICKEQGYLDLGNWEDGAEYLVTYRQIEEARAHLLPEGTLPIKCPVRIIHGMGDEVVPWQHSLEIVEQVESRDVAITLPKESDHRLSAPDDLLLIRQSLEDLVRVA